MIKKKILDPHKKKKKNVKNFKLKTKMRAMHLNAFQKKFQISNYMFWSNFEKRGSEYRQLNNQKVSIPQ